MTTGELSDKVLEKHPFAFRNNRGSFKTERGYITFGIPAPPRGRKEKESDMKGGDFIGMTEDGTFLNVEVKGENDIIAEGQVRWHNFVLQHGGISEIWLSTGKIINWKTTKEEVNNGNL